MTLTASADLRAGLRAKGGEAGARYSTPPTPSRWAHSWTKWPQRHGRLSALVNSVGIQRYGTVESTSPETWDEVLAVNVKSMFLMAKHAVPLMRQNGSGAIVNISSAQAVASQRNVVAYTASKGAIVAMTRAMAVDHAPRGHPRQQHLPGFNRHAHAQGGEHEKCRRTTRTGSSRSGARCTRCAGSGTRAKLLTRSFTLSARWLRSLPGADLRVDGGLLAGVALVAPADDSDEK